MTRQILTAMVVLSALGVGPVAAQGDDGKGYLSEGELDVTAIIPPAPAKGDPRFEMDRRIFRETRRLAGTSRWMLATRDVDYAASAMLRNFSCSVRVALTPENAPKLVSLISRAGADTIGQSNLAKQYYRRERPFVLDRGKICQSSAELYDRHARRMSYDYPSGHATWGWTWALILTNVVPGRARQILERGRAFGDSRFICGAHSFSAVEAGRLSASASIALIQTKSEYQSDLAAARGEYGRLKVTGDPPSGCETEEAWLKEAVTPPSGRTAKR